MSYNSGCTTPMDAERWQQVDRLYHSALEREPGERSAFLAQACHGDEDLKREVDELLAQDSSSGNILDDPPADLLADSTVTQLTAGTQLGPYEILGPLDAGGMGEVYRARDPRTGRDVAIKVSAERFSDRFSREVHAIAALNQPNICTLYDVGRNYLVMELVEGPTLAERIKRGAIPLPEALGIAQQIADAFEAAHEKASPIATSSQPTSRSSRMAWSRCSTSDWRKCRKHRLKPVPLSAWPQPKPE